MILKQIKSTIFTTSLLLSGCLLAQSNQNEKADFQNAKIEVENMLAGKTPLNYEKAVFITENVYNGKKYSYQDFKKELDIYSQAIADFYLINKTKSVSDFTATLTETAETKYNRYCQNLVNYSIYKFIADTMRLVYNDTVYSHTPFNYSFSDPIATKDWSNAQVTNLLLNSNQTGNCYALVSMFKIFSERFNSEALINTAPHHVFISHEDYKGVTYNVELGARAFTGTGSIEVLTYTTDKALKSKIAMRRLDLQQSVALNLVYLAKSYQHKFNVTNDKFILSCANTVLKYDSLNLNAMLLKAEVLEAELFEKMKANQITDIVQAKKSTFTKTEFYNYEKQIKLLYDLGYLEMPTEMKNIILAGYNKDPYIVVKDHTPTAMSSTGAKHDKDYITLSGGLFDENPQPKAKEKYLNIIFDTKLRQVVSIAPKEETYNKYDFDPVLFAWQIDPMAPKYPSITPYAAFSNNPIVFVDADGNENIVYLVVANGTKSKVSIENANSIAAEANKAYENLGLKTRVVVVTDANFNSKYINASDAVAIYGSTKQQQRILEKQGPHVNLFREVVKDQVNNGYGTSNYPELSQNQIDYNRSGQKGGEFILINEQALPQYAKSNKSTVSEAGAFLLLHGAGHNSGVNHNQPGNMISSEGSKVFSTLNNGVLATNENGEGVSWPNEYGFKSVVDFMRNRNIKTGVLQNEAYKSAIIKRFGNNTAKDNYKANKESCESDCK